MNAYSFELSLAGLMVSVLFRIIAAGFYAFVIYRAWKENGVKNGLIILRKQMLITSIILFCINTLGMGLLIIRIFVNATIFRIATDALALLNSIGLFVVAYLLFKLYTQKFSPEEIVHHKQIAELEKKRLKLVEKKATILAAKIDKKSNK